MKRLLILLLVISIQLAAHESIETTACKPPSNTGRITSDMEREIFQAELGIYESCMVRTIQDQQQQADVHEQAADKTLDTWTDYLHSRLP